MPLRTFLQTLVLILSYLVLLGPLKAEDALPPAEKAKIEALLDHVGALKDATFIRNGTEYDCKTAVKFFRGKWESQAKEIKTVEDFIAKAAAKSSTTGKPYLIRLKGEKEAPFADYLTAQLKKPETKPETPPQEVPKEAPKVK